MERVLGKKNVEFKSALLHSKLDFVSQTVVDGLGKDICMIKSLKKMKIMIIKCILRTEMSKPLNRLG